MTIEQRGRPEVEVALAIQGILARSLGVEPMAHGDELTPEARGLTHSSEIHDVGLGLLQGAAQSGELPRDVTQDPHMPPVDLAAAQGNAHGREHRHVRRRRHQLTHRAKALATAAAQPRGGIARTVCRPLRRVREALGDGRRGPLQLAPHTPEIADSLAQRPLGQLRWIDPRQRIGRLEQRFPCYGQARIGAG